MKYKFKERAGMTGRGPAPPLIRTTLVNYYSIIDIMRRTMKIKEKKVKVTLYLTSQLFKELTRYVCIRKMRGFKCSNSYIMNRALGKYFANNCVRCHGEG